MNVLNSDKTSNLYNSKPDFNKKLMRDYLNSEYLRYQRLYKSYKYGSSSNIT